MIDVNRLIGVINASVSESMDTLFVAKELADIVKGPDEAGQVMMALGAGAANLLHQRYGKEGFYSLRILEGELSAEHQSAAQLFMAFLNEDPDTANAVANVVVDAGAPHVRKVIVEQLRLIAEIMHAYRVPK